MKIVFALVMGSFLLSGGFLMAGGKPQVREFRPLTAKSAVRVPSGSIVARPIEPTAGKFVATSGKSADPVADSKRATGMGFQYYDRQMWEPSREWFMTALSWDSSNRKAAEGLIMAVYHGESPADAYVLGNEFSSVMPGILNMVTDAVSDEAERLISAGEREAAKSLLEGFPANEKQLDSAREKLYAEGSFESEVPATRKKAAEQEEEKLPSAVEFIKQARANQALGREPVPGVKRKKMLYAAAKEAHFSERYRSSLWFIDEAEKFGSLDSDMKNIKAWNLYATGRSEEAMNIFEQVYRGNIQNSDAARGLLLSLNDLNAQDYLSEIRVELGGALNDLDFEHFEREESLFGSCSGISESVEDAGGFEFAGLDANDPALH